MFLLLSLKSKGLRTQTYVEYEVVKLFRDSKGWLTLVAQKELFDCDHENLKPPETDLNYVGGIPEEYSAKKRNR